MKIRALLFLVLPVALTLAEEELTIAPRGPTAEEKAARAREYLSMVTALGEKDQSKFEAAVHGVAASGNEKAAEHLQRAYPQVDGVRRRVLLQALGGLKREALKDWYFGLSFSEPYLGLRRAAADALVAILGRAGTARLYLEFLNRADAGQNSAGRQRALQLLAHVGGKDSAGRFRELLSDGDPNVVIESCDALAVMHDDRAVASLLKILESRHPETAPAAREALTRITGQDHGGNLVKWSQTLQDWKPGLAADGYDSETKYVPDYGRPYEIPLAEAPVDFVVVYDTTGSLGRIWPTVSLQLDAVLGEMAQRCYSLRLGTVRYRAPDADRKRYVIEPFPLTRDLQKARDNIQDATFGGGSGALHLGMLHAISAFQWRASARKAILVVGDITPVDDGLKLCLQTIHEGRMLDQIYFNTLYIRSSHGEEHRPIYGRMAALGAGRFYEFDRAEKHFVDWSVEKPDPRTSEPHVETLKKWMTPLPRQP